MHRFLPNNMGTYGKLMKSWTQFSVDSGFRFTRSQKSGFSNFSIFRSTVQAFRLDIFLATKGQKICWNIETDVGQQTKPGKKVSIRTTQGSSVSLASSDLPLKEIRYDHCPNGIWYSTIINPRLPCWVRGLVQRTSTLRGWGGFRGCWTHFALRLSHICPKVRVRGLKYCSPFC